MESKKRAECKISKPIQKTRKKQTAKKPKLLPCPFCGRKALYIEYGVHVDPFTGERRTDCRIGCPSAFAPVGDWGAEKKKDRCFVAPIICSIPNRGVDIAEEWNKRSKGVSDEDNNLV